MTALNPGAAGTDRTVPYAFLNDIFTLCRHHSAKLQTVRKTNLEDTDEYIVSVIWKTPGKGTAALQKRETPVGVPGETGAEAEKPAVGDTVTYSGYLSDRKGKPARILSVGKTYSTIQFLHDDHEMHAQNTSLSKVDSND